MTAERSRYYTPKVICRDATDAYHLPPMKQLLKDFAQCGGSLRKFLNKHIPKKTDQLLVALQIIHELETSPNTEHKKTWDRIRKDGLEVQALVIEDAVVAVAADPDDRNCMQAAKFLLDRAMKAGKGGSGKESTQVDPLDALIADMAKKEAES